MVLPRTIGPGPFPKPTVVDPKPGEHSARAPVPQDPRQKAIQDTRAARTPAAGAPSGVAPPSSFQRDPGGGDLINPPLHPLAETHFPDGMRLKIKRGVLIRMEEVVGDTSTVTSRANRYRFRFLYNPESIAISTNVFQGAVPPNFKTQVTDGSPDFVAKFVGQETVTFGLMVDRTQEVYEQGPASTKGTLPDIEALYRAINGSVGSKAGFLYLSTVKLQWSSAPNALPAFTGYVTSVNVTHTKFTPYMTPMRSLIDLSLARISTTEIGEAAQETFDERLGGGEGG